MSTTQDAIDRTLLMLADECTCSNPECRGGLLRRVERLVELLGHTLAPAAATTPAVPGE